MDFDVIVIGGGPAGCFAAKHIAVNGFRVLILEEHDLVGEPVQCAGLLSRRAIELSGVSSKVLINELKGARVYSTLGACLELAGGCTWAAAVDRSMFDRELAEQAQSGGAFLLTGTRARGLEQTPGGYLVSCSSKKQRDLTFSTRLIVGADGAKSQVARWLNLQPGAFKAVICAADSELDRTYTDLADIFLGREFSPGWFGWIIPLDHKRCRIGAGYAFIREAYSPRYCLNQLINRFPDHFRGIKIVRHTGGVVPMGLMPKIYSDHAMLVGDAACQTKPISGGGIYLGLRGAQMCAAVAVKALNEEDLSQDILSLYQELWHREFGGEVRSGISHRLNYSNLDDHEIDTILRFLNKPFWQKTILEQGDIDFPSWLSRSLSSAGPWKKKLLKGMLSVLNWGSALKSSMNLNCTDLEQEV
jgi:geranylgeranyl reductase family protein